MIQQSTSKHMPKRNENMFIQKSYTQCSQQPKCISNPNVHHFMNKQTNQGIIVQ